MDRYDKKKKIRINKNTMFFSWYLPTDHCDNISEKIKNSKTQLIMYDKASNINDWSTMKYLHKSYDCLTYKIVDNTKIKQVCSFFISLSRFFFLFCSFYAYASRIFTWIVLAAVCMYGCVYVYVNDNDSPPCILTWLLVSSRYWLTTTCICII
jgi:hypothetical protein